MVELVSPPEVDKTAVSRERAERRRAVARQLKDQRERLASSSGVRPGFSQELVLAFAQNRLKAAVAAPLLILLAAALAVPYVEPPLIGAWAALALAIYLLTLFLAGSFARSPDVPAKALAGSVRLFIVADLTFGLAWGAILVLIDRSAGIGVDVILVSVALTVIAVGSVVAAPLPAACLGATLPVAVTLVILLLGRFSAVHAGLAFLTVAAELFFLVVAQRLRAATLTSLNSSAEKNHLLAEFGTAKALSDEARRRAEEANLAKSRFLATMSHELRTPLNAILGFSEVMQNEVLGPMENSAYRDYAKDIHTSGQHLLTLINEILDLSRIEAGRYELNEAPVSLAEAVEACRHLTLLKARSKNIAVEIEAEPAMPRLLADERAVRQIVLNLLSNAVKFTPCDGRVTIRVGWTSGGGQYVSVRDNGPGIPEAEIPIVLSAFGQGSLAIKGAEQGAGLGLSIVQALARMHDGTFELRSKLREGTEAIACFPKSRVLAALPANDARAGRRGRAG